MGTSVPMYCAQRLPPARGPVSSSLLRRLRTARGSIAPPLGSDILGDDDVQLALHVIYELSYRGYVDVDERAERDSEVLRSCQQIEDAMEHQLRQEVGPCSEDPVELLRSLAGSGDGPSLSGYLEAHADLGKIREFAVHRSAYQLKEADPHSWALPRLSGRAKSAFVEIQADEYGQGIPGATHAELWAETMEALDLDPTYGRYIDLLPASTLATGNLIGLLGRQHRLLPAVLGHLALFEMTSTGPMARYSSALAATGVPERGRRFFDVHVEADAHHELVAIDDLVGGFLEDRPTAGREISFGALALDLVERRFALHLLRSFEAGRSSLRALPTDQIDGPTGHGSRRSVDPRHVRVMAG